MGGVTPCRGRNRWRSAWRGRPIVHAFGSSGAMGSRPSVRATCCDRRQPTDWLRPSEARLQLSQDSARPIPLDAWPSPGITHRAVSPRRLNIAPLLEQNRYRSRRRGCHSFYTNRNGSTRPLTGAFSRGRSRRYPYCVCQAKPCSKAGHVHEEFEDFLNTVTPQPDLLDRIRDLIVREVQDVLPRGEAAATRS